MGRWGIRSLKTRVGQEYSISRGGAGFHSEGIRAGGARGGGSHSVMAGGAAPRVRAAKSSEIR